MTECSIEGCADKVLARGWCAPHYQRWHRTGDPEATPQRRPRPECSVDDCGNPHVASGWCAKHYERVRRWGDPNRVYGCPCCQHSESTALDAAILSGTKYDDIGDRFSLNRAQVSRHAVKHLGIRRVGPVAQCFVCQRADVEEIEDALAEAPTKMEVSKRFGLNYKSLSHHVTRGHAALRAESEARRLAAVREWVSA